MNLPRSIHQYRIGLGQSVSAGRLTAEQAGKSLAEFLTDKHPLIAAAILVNWCTARFKRYNPAPEGWVQTGLWPLSTWNEPLAVAIAYAESQAMMTSRFSARDVKRRDELEILKEAAGGDLSVTLDEAYRLAFPDDQEATG